MKVARLHLSTYQDKGNGKFTMDVSWYKDPEAIVLDKRGPQYREKPSPSPTQAELLALFQALFPKYDVAWAE